MIIDNYELVNIVLQAINRYNDEYYDEKDKDKRIPYDAIKLTNDDECMEIPDELLAKLPYLDFTLRPYKHSSEEIKDMFEKLKDILDVMQPTTFRLSAINKKGEIFKDFDFSILEHLRPDLEYLILNGIDMSNIHDTTFSKFQNLKSLNLENCNISDPSVAYQVNSNAIVSLRRNKIAPEKYDLALRILQERKGKTSFQDTDLERLSDILSFGTLSIQEYLKYKDMVDLSKIKSIKISYLKDANLSPEDAAKFVEIFNENPNISLELSRETLSSLDPERNISRPYSMAVRDLRDLSVEELEGNPQIESIRIMDDKNPNRADYNTYTREEYLQVRKIVQEIVSMVKLPPENDPHREKKIFTQVYKILGEKIKYDYSAISEEGKQDEALARTCRNLVGGLTKNTCVCAGYADILKNVLAMFNIEAEFVGAIPDFENGVPLNINDPEGHAWNLVTLDGEKFWTDLTWDAPYIQKGKFPLPYFLKSTKEFNHDSFQKRLEDLRKDPAPRSVSHEDQIRLFTGRDLQDQEVLAKKPDAVSYLGVYTLAAARKGTSLKALSRAEECCLMAIKKPDQVKTTDEEVK